MIIPDWPAHPRVRAAMTTRAEGDAAGPAARAALRAQLPAEPAWLRQVHGTAVHADPAAGAEGDAAVTRRSGVVCTVMAADCMPVLLADEAGTVVAAAHAGWRGLCAGVLEATVRSMQAAAVTAWLGPAIGPSAYEVGAEVREAFLAADPLSAAAFTAARPGHWLLDLYAVARQRLRHAGVRDIHGGGYCTFTDRERFYSWRRDRTAARMAAFIWLT